MSFCHTIHQCDTKNNRSRSIARLILILPKFDFRDFEFRIFEFGALSKIGRLVPPEVTMDRSQMTASQFRTNKQTVHQSVDQSVSLLVSQ